jgi:hypothetical protein
MRFRNLKIDPALRKVSVLGRGGKNEGETLRRCGVNGLEILKDLKNSVWQG